MEINVRKARFTALTGRVSAYDASITFTTALPTMTPSAIFTYKRLNFSTVRPAWRMSFRSRPGPSS